MAKSGTYYTLVKDREDGDYDILMTFNANTGDDELDDAIAHYAEQTLIAFQQTIGDGYKLVERQDAPDLLDGEEIQ